MTTSIYAKTQDEWAAIEQRAKRAARDASPRTHTAPLVPVIMGPSTQEAINVETGADDAEAAMAKELRSIQAASRRLRAELKSLGELVTTLHPGEDGASMQARLKDFSADKAVREQMRDFARQWANLRSKGLIEQIAGHQLKEQIAEFWPLRVVLGGNGEPCRLEIVESTTPAPQTHDAIDQTLLATRQELIDAYGKFTGMVLTWFDNLTDSPALLGARKVVGRGQRGHSKEPLFCPFEVMQWLIDPKRKKGRKDLSEAKGWGILEKSFPRAFNIRSVGDPRTPD